MDLGCPPADLSAFRPCPVVKPLWEEGGWGNCLVQGTCVQSSWSCLVTTPMHLGGGGGIICQPCTLLAVILIGALLTREDRATDNCVLVTA
jgi:hypothetical protein